MPYQMNAVLSLPYKPTPAKLEEIGHILAANKVAQMKTGDRTISVLGLFESKNMAKEMAQLIGRAVRKTMNCKLEGSLRIREVSTPETQPLLFEQQMTLALKEADYRLNFGATFIRGAGLGHIGLYQGSRKLFSYQDIALKGVNHINQAQYAALIEGMKEAEYTLRVNEGLKLEDVVLTVVSPCEAVIKQCGMGPQDVSQWSIPPQLVSWVKGVMEYSGRFKQVRFRLPEQIRSK